MIAVCEMDVLPSEGQFVEYANSNVDSVVMMEVGMIQWNETTNQAGMITELLKHKDSLIRKGETRDVNEYHKALGHTSEAIAHATAHTEGLLYFIERKVQSLQRLCSWKGKTSYYKQESSP